MWVFPPTNLLKFIIGMVCASTDHWLINCADPKYYRYCLLSAMSLRDTNDHENRLFS